MPFDQETLLRRLAERLPVAEWADEWDACAAELDALLAVEDTWHGAAAAAWRTANKAMLDEPESLRAMFWQAVVHDVGLARLGSRFAADVERLLLDDGGTPE